ncbi:MAG: hypothetical protein AAF846_22245 [Chloroflexota bacterium]
MRYFILIALVTIAYRVHAAPLQTGFVDDNNPVLDYSGSWNDGTYVDAYGGAYQFTSDISSLISFETYATGITIFFIFDTLGDDIEVCVESDCTTVSTAGMVAVGKVELTNIGTGLKNVTISKVTSDSSVFLFDAVYVHPSPNDKQEVSEQTIEFEYEGQTHTGVLDLRLTSGDAIQVLLLMAIVLLQIFRLIGDLLT